MTPHFINKALSGYFPVQGPSQHCSGLGPSVSETQMWARYVCTALSLGGLVSPADLAGSLRVSS